MVSFLLFPLLPSRYARHKQVSNFISRFLLLIHAILCFSGFDHDRGFSISALCCRIWSVPETNGQVISRHRHEQELQIVSEDNPIKMVSVCIWLPYLYDWLIPLRIWVWFSVSWKNFKPAEKRDMMTEVYRTNEAIKLVQLVLYISSFVGTN